MIDAGQRAAIVAGLEAARGARKPTALPRAEYPGLTLADAYAIQSDWTAWRTRNEGRRPIGYKVGLTTRGMQHNLGTDRPLYGVLLDDMAFDEGAPIPMDRFLSPRVEMELAFCMARRLSGPCTEAEAIAAIDWIAPAIEIIDSRTVMRDAATGATRAAIDVVADGGGAAGFVVSSQRMRPGEVDLSRIGAVLYQNDEPEDSGMFPLILRRPERALVWLAGALAERGCAIEAGEIILSGSIIKPYPVARGDRFTFDFGDQGSIALRFE
ncbi:MAG: 2-oxo-hepta-3-ene-1,7-dioic acid hydratase [Sphingomonadales bacterium]|nr:MAG: 2-oxo-hepta-3-ene-1,7-dioic acid hydratase [Sphingomonadales bacterium]